jgi:teichoic acid transport system permease protein
MGNRGRLIAPGGLRDELAAVAEDDPAAGESLAEMAAQYGLRPSSARPRLVSYLVKVWQRRHFIFAYATARNVSMYTEARLGQLWQVLTPLLNSAVYYLIFGILFKANRGISNYTAYLVTGVFVFAFTERSIVVGSTVMRANMTLIRALHFPRACLPLAYVLVELQQLLLSMVVLFAIVLGTGEPLTWYWLLLLPALLMQATFNVGAALIMARVSYGWPGPAGRSSPSSQACCTSGRHAPQVHHMAGGGPVTAANDALLRDFAIRAVKAQPLGYLHAVLGGLALSVEWPRHPYPDPAPCTSTTST